MSLPHSLLALLANRPMIGQHLKDAFEAQTGAVWPLNTGQIYTTLARLERDGFVEQRTEDSGAQYELTEAGRGELEQWLRSPGTDRTPPRSELVMKVMVSAVVPGVDRTEIVQTHRRDAIETMQALTRVKASALDDLALVLVTDAELFRLEAIVRWLDVVDARLGRGDSLTLAAAPDEPKRRRASREAVR
jgi:DNA-binding PadR family transcriptional regulator